MEQTNVTIDVPYIYARWYEQAKKATKNETNQYWIDEKIKIPGDAKEFVADILDNFYTADGYSVQQLDGHSFFTSTDGLTLICMYISSDSLHAYFRIMSPHRENEVFNRIQDKYSSNTKAKAYANWYFRSGTQISETVFEVQENKIKISDEFYPFIEGGVDALYENFLNSDDQVLVLMGPPGTGKTSFIKDLLIKHSLRCNLTYEKDIMFSDDFFIQFLVGSSQAIVMEDADDLIKNREDSQNHIMSKFLNISDGIIKASSKKLIFSTNITDEKEIDPALIRPGRCYKLINFRELTGEEANVVSNLVGKEPSYEASERVTLSEVLNGSKNIVTKHKVGFL